MYSGFKKIIVIDPKREVGILVRDVMKELGAVETAVVENVKSAWDFLQTAEATPDWILTFADRDKKFHFFNLLNLIIKEPEFSKVRVSLLVTEDDYDLLPVAFDLGVMSFHKKPFTKGNLLSEFQYLINSASKNLDEHFLIAAEYLRKFFNEKEAYEDRVNFEKNMITKFPRHPGLFLSLAEAQILAGQEEEARKTLGIAKHLGQDLASGVNQLTERLEKKDEPEPTFAESFGIHSVIIIEPDDAVAKQINESMIKLGISDISIYQDGQSGIDALGAKPDCSLLISEWKLPKLSGPALVQRIRQSGNVNLPIVIISSLVKDKDRNLLKEIGVSAIVKKPLSIAHLVTEITQVFEAERISQPAQDIERKIRQFLSTGKTRDAESLYEQARKSNSIPKGTRLLIEANILFHNEKFAKARDAAMEALKENGEAVIILNLLSKIFLKLNDREAALKCLNRAQEYSSDNLERLVTIAETYSNSGNIGKAQEILASAKKVDGESKIVMQAEAEIAITVGDKNTAKGIISKMDSAKSLVANMNNRAVLLVNNGDIEKGLKLYQDAMSSLPEELALEHEIISYNLALAYSRINQLQEARPILERLMLSTKSVGMKEKARALFSRVDEAICSKKKIQLNLPKESPKQIAASNFEKPIALHLQPGQLCLHGIYDSGEQFTKNHAEIIKAIPQFSKHKHATIIRVKAS